jgi:Phage terminase, small subunit
MKKTPKLTVIETTPTASSPRRNSDSRGAKLRQSILSEFEIEDAAGTVILDQICAAVDRLDGISEQIRADGVMVKGRTGRRPHPLLKSETTLRAFIVRSLAKLGLEPLEPSVGRPARGFGVTFDSED